MSHPTLPPLSLGFRLGLAMAGLLGQALGAGSLRAPFLPLAGPTPAPSPPRSTPAGDATTRAAVLAVLGAIRAAHPALAADVDHLVQLSGAAPGGGAPERR